jgi:photosystem II stability/assembly factor-like uncharacterized protein
MVDHIFLTVNGNGISRLQRHSGGDSGVERLLEGQDVSCLAANSLSPSTVYAGTRKNGILRSEDYGQTWESCGLAGQAVMAIEVSPHDPKVIFAGTRPAYLFLSSDGGASWQELLGFRRIPFRWWWFSPAEAPFKAYVNAISVSPSDPNVILAGIEFGAVVRSEDGGIHWSGHCPGALRDCHTLKFHVSNGDWAYEAGGSGGGASFSRDGGKTWIKSNHGFASSYGVACAADPQRPELWYVSIAPGPSKAYGNDVEAYLYRSTSQAGWQPIGWEPQPMTGMPLALVTRPDSPGLVYAGLGNGEVWRSTDNGDAWEKMDFNLGRIWHSLLVL